MDLTDIDPKFTPINNEQINYLDSMIKEYNKENKIIAHDVKEVFKKEMGSNKNMYSMYTPYCMLRLLSDLIEELPDKIIYLDTDTVFKGDIKELYNIDINEYEYGAALDYLGWFFMRYKAKNYINSGVLLMNMKKIKETKLLEKCRKLCLTKKMGFPDQDALNIAVKNKLIIDSKFNRQRKAKDDTIIQHFCNGITFKYIIPTLYKIKPWQVDKVRNVLKIHIYDELLDEYQSRMKEINTKKEAI
jgi:lipopolysaccharide biosynthesis glycosyltransferase